MQARREEARTQESIASFQSDIHDSQRVLPCDRFPGGWRRVHGNDTLKTTALEWTLDPEEVRRTCKSTPLTHASQVWKDQHVGIQAEDVPVRPVPPAQTRLCHQIGLCLCGHRGLLVRRFHQRLQRHIMASFATKNDKDLLLHGCIVLELQANGGPEVMHRRFFHLSLLQQRPWRMMCLHLRLQSTGEEDGSALLCLPDPPEVAEEFGVKF